MPASTTDVGQLAINTIRTLSMDAVEQAGCGHPGTPMALAPVAYKLWNDVLSYDPADPLWPARDRFVLSCGHASMLLYSVIHLAGIREVDSAGRVGAGPSLSLDELRNFRQWQSRTPGHPEYGHTAGVETTTGPLGQGCGNSVGMAIAGKWLAARYDRPGLELFGYDVYALCSDGDLMEGVACEAASLAGHLRLANLCWIYDDNKITIEGDTDLAFSEDVPQRFRGLGWHVVEVDDANDLHALGQAFDAFAGERNAPMLIVVSSEIGYGAPNKQGSHDAHGAALGADEVRATKAAYGWPEEETFLVPPEVPEHFAEGIGRRGAERHAAWRERLEQYRAAYAAEAAELETIWRGELPAGWDADLPVFEASAKGNATRNTSGESLNALAGSVPWLLGGSADLAPSTKTLLKGESDFSADDYAGRNFHFGIREHGMTAIVNGMALSGLRPYGATFFVFCDYLRPSLRLAALMGVPSILVFTHDSIGVGEDGPTHQPVEQLAATRAIPGVVVLRPGDANETAQAWKAALESRHRPVALVLTRQNVPTLDRSRYAPAEGVARGAYVLADAPNGKPQVILIGTGSELSLAVEAHEQLTAEGIAARVVSMPSWELFEDQDAAYRASVFPADVPARVAVEAGVRQGWDRYLGTDGRFIGMRSFGASAPAEQVYEGFGITAEAVVEAAREAVGA